MNIYLDSSANFNSRDFQEFLFKPYSVPPSSQNMFEVVPPLPTDFEHDPNDTRSSGEQGELENIPFQVEEEYAIEKGEGRDNILNGGCPANGTVEMLGTVKIIAAYEQEVEINVQYVLYLKKKALIPQKAHELAKKLFHQYRPTQGVSLESWVKGELKDGLTEDMFSIETVMLIEKVSDRNVWTQTMPDGRIVTGEDQRNSLFRLYCENEGGTIYFNQGDPDRIDYGHWADQEKIGCRFLREKLLFGVDEPPQYAEVEESKNPPTQHQRDSIVNRLVDIVLPPNHNCGIMKKHDQRILKLVEWPEFKIVWRKKRIKIGCSSITISYPVLKIRWSEIHFYAYLSVPEDVGTAAINIAKSCALSSALKGAVVGAILGNLALAITTFQISFKDCVKREIKKCIVSGLFTIKEVGQWK